MYEGAWVSTLSVYRPLILVQELKQEIVKNQHHQLYRVFPPQSRQYRPFDETPALNKHSNCLPIYQIHLYRVSKAIYHPNSGILGEG